MAKHIRSTALYTMTDHFGGGGCHPTNVPSGSTHGSNSRIVWRSRPSQEEEGLVKCLYQVCVRHTESGCPRKYAINGGVA